MSEWWVFDGRQHLMAQIVACEKRVAELEAATRNANVFLEALEKTLQSRDVHLAAVIRNHLRSMEAEEEEA